MARKAVVLALCLMFLPMLVFAQDTELKKKAASMEEAGGEILKAIRTTHESYVKAFQEEDIDGVMALFADSPNTILMGTGPDEIWLGKENIKAAHLAFFTTSGDESSEGQLVSVGAEGNIAWYSGYLVISGESNTSSETYQINLSVVLKQVENNWYFSAMHFSNLIGPK